MDLRITEVVKKPYPQLKAQLLKVRPASPTVQCPEAGTTITFTPETPDYQATLARRQWPAKGQSLRIDYRYLNGICKGDGNEHACRIEHYPVGRR
ncbi:hypothetical protein [Pseudomonas citri]|uniref:hypothetical protein n=1 Tax=Pseudomonas citri TaxID=2978349 RepID=UPI0028CB68D4|nr:hypothetical protein [Pseudomonas citri]